MICLYPKVECCSKLKEFQALLEGRNIFHAALYQKNKLSLGIKEKDSHQVIELAALNRIDFESSFDSLTYKNRNLVKVSL